MHSLYKYFEFAYNSKSSNSSQRRILFSRFTISPTYPALQYMYTLIYNITNIFNTYRATYPLSTYTYQMFVISKNNNLLEKFLFLLGVSKLDYKVEDYLLDTFNKTYTYLGRYLGVQELLVSVHILFKSSVSEYYGCDRNSLATT